MTREQTLFAAARRLIELHPVDRTNWFQPDSASHLHQMATVEAENELIIALAAYEGHAVLSSPALPAGEGGRRPDEGQPAQPFNNGTR